MSDQRTTSEAPQKDRLEPWRPAFDKILTAIAAVQRLSGSERG